MKICNKCNEEKYIDEFYKDSTKKDGLRTMCKSCTSLYRELNKSSIKEYQKGYMKTYQLDKRSRLGYDMKYLYRLTLEEAEEVYSRGCELCGSKLNLNIDHCHTTNKVRGCLCSGCNTKVGYYERMRDNNEFDLIEQYLNNKKVYYN